VIHRARIGTLVLLLFTLACAGPTVTPQATSTTPTPGSTLTTPVPESTATPESPESPSATEPPASDSPFTEVTDAIVSIIPAVGIDEEGQPVEPGFNFSPDTPQITIVVQAGEVAGSPMNLTWFQVTDDGEQELFTHAVEVASFQSAWSVGDNPGMLADSSYRVDATFEGQAMSTTFRVGVPDGPPFALAAGSRALDAHGAGGQGGANSGPPTSGDSGVLGPRADLETGAASTFLDAWLEYEPMDPGARDIMLGIGAGAVGGAARVEVNVQMGGNLQTVSYPTRADGLLVKYLNFNPCAHPGGSDLPGTTARFVLNLLGEGTYPDNFLAETVQNDTVLGEDLTSPRVDLDGPPANARRVSPGDEIVFDASAQETRDGPTWQTGLKSFKLVAKPGGLIGEEQTSDAGSAQPCDLKQWALESLATYTVPVDAPPVIEICGIAEDFAGNEGWTCLDLYTAEIWDGTVNSVVTVDGPGGPCGTRIPIDGLAQFVVADDGTVKGTYDVTGCQVSQPHADFTGTATAEQFLFPILIVFTNGEPIPKVSPTHAQGTFTNQQGPATTWVTTWDMSCISCL
jgi:hypothetical protein